MCSALLLLSLLAAIDPVRIGITAFLIARKRPMLNLLTFWLGGLAGGVAAAVAVLLFLRDFTLGVMRAVVSATSSPIVSYLQVVVGALTVSLAALLLIRLAARKRSPVAATAVADVVTKLQDAGDAMLAAVIYHSDHLELSEQFDGVTGYEKSVKNLTWSYAAFLSAVRARTGQNVQG